MADVAMKPMSMGASMVARIERELENLRERIARLEAGKIGWLVAVTALMLALLYMDNRFRMVEANQTQLYEKLNEKINENHREILNRLPPVTGQSPAELPAPASPHEVSPPVQPHEVSPPAPALAPNPYWWRDGMWV